MTREEAYETVANLAAEHALIAQAYGGVIVIAHPATQREQGIEAHCLYVAGQGAHPTTIAQRQQAAEQTAARRRQAEQLDIFNESKEPAA